MNLIVSVNFESDLKTYISCKQGLIYAKMGGGEFLDTVPLKDYAHDTLCIEVKFILKEMW